MKLEYLQAGSRDCPLIRLFDFSADEAKYLHAELFTLASETVDRVEIQELPFVTPVDGCRLALVQQGWDQGVAYDPTKSFVCGYTPGAWNNIAGLVEPFTRRAAGFQWLAGTPGEVRLLLSASGEW